MTRFVVLTAVLLTIAAPAVADEYRYTAYVVRVIDGGGLFFANELQKQPKEG